ncbi:hypothetical protein CGRA01v4_11397 [Colletotrichum graminicola]|nr:hypothetical protein CGRA01v4_11397 [Colletotrichum graminicola]
MHKSIANGMGIEEVAIEDAHPPLDKRKSIWSFDSRDAKLKVRVIPGLGLPGPDDKIGS